MWIHDENAPTAGLRVPGISEEYRESGVEIPESGVAQVDRQTAEALIEHCPSITEHDPEEGDDE